jgi:hypothetical protein
MREAMPLLPQYAFVACNSVSEGYLSSVFSVNSNYMRPLKNAAYVKIAVDTVVQTKKAFLPKEVQHA